MEIMKNNHLLNFFKNSCHPQNWQYAYKNPREKGPTFSEVLTTRWCFLDQEQGLDYVKGDLKSVEVLIY